MIQKRTLSKILYNEQQSKDLFSLSITTLCSLSVLITLQSLIKPTDWQASYSSCVWRGFLIVSESLASCSSKLILWPCLTCLFNLTGCMLFSISAVQIWPPISERCLLTSNISLLFHVTIPAFQRVLLKPFHRRKIHAFLSSYNFFLLASCSLQVSHCFSCSF